MTGIAKTERNMVPKWCSKKKGPCSLKTQKDEREKVRKNDLVSPSFYARVFPWILSDNQLEGANASTVVYISNLSYPPV